jgi:FAD/FMN-containing dehydrogenase
VPPVALDAFLDGARAALGAARVITDPDVVGPHATDWTGRWQGRPPAVLRPGSVADVAAVVVLARRHRIGLVPQGGNTGLVAGATPLGGEVVVDLRRLDALGPVDVAAAQVTVGAGATLAAVQIHVGSAGLAVGVDLGARDSATIGGMVATNAGGLHVVRHWTMRAQVLGVAAVLGRGDVVDLNPTGLVKDNTGYDLAGLLCGSEGTLGIITSVRLRLVPVPAERAAVLLGFASVADAVDALPRLRSVPGAQAIELVLADGVRLVAAHIDRRLPLDPLPDALVLLEVAGDRDPLGAVQAALDQLGSSVVATAAATEPAALAALWRWREAHPDAAAARGLVHKADVTVPLGGLAAFVAEVPAAVEAVAPGATTLVYGHLGDGNLHVNVIGPAADDSRAVDVVLELVLAQGGSVSAEHGVGRAKVAWMARQRGPAAVAAMRAVKGALDPDGILNPGAVLA